ncbi:MAG: hypothetical protein H7196_02155 [candidate division SR1 bacterium]|nr:hypothetical protein [candidate division SR1 bacterium]
MLKQKNLSILGSGGHGWESIKHVIDSYDGLVTIYMLPVDWGGSTGTIGRLLKLRNGELNKLLHNDLNYPILPFGDLNKFIATYVEQACGNHVLIEYKEKVINCLEFRSDSYLALLRVFTKIICCLKLDVVIVEKFEIYLKTYLEYYLEFKDYLVHSKTTSLGNLWHSFLFYEFGSIKGLVNFYQKNNMLPQNFSIEFTSENREILKGTYFNEHNHSFELNGEDLIDASDYPIDPTSFELLTIEKNQPKVNSQFLENLKKSSTIIIPNGSLANWIPLIKINNITKILREKATNGQLIWVMNLFHSKNEYPFDVYYHYISTLEITPIILGPLSIPTEYYVSFLKEYQKEGKTLNYNLNTQAHDGKNLKVGFNNCLEVISHLEDERIEGIKYRKECIKNIIIQHLSL